MTAATVPGRGRRRVGGDLGHAARTERAAQRFPQIVEDGGIEIQRLECRVGVLGGERPLQGRAVGAVRQIRYRPLERVPNIWCQAVQQAMKLAGGHGPDQSGRSGFLVNPPDSRGRAPPMVWSC